LRNARLSISELIDAIWDAAVGRPELGILPIYPKTNRESTLKKPPLGLSVELVGQIQALGKKLRDSGGLTRRRLVGALAKKTGTALGTAYRYIQSAEKRGYLKL
jgi:hypothetical protein